MIVWLWLGLSQASEVRVALGGQLETEGHGILDVGWRRGPLSVQLFTDTLDLRLTRSSDHGRWSMGLRAAAFAAGLWITPWDNGAPDPTRAQQASYFGPDLEVQRYLPGGLWVGGAAFFRPHRFRPLPLSTLRVPDTAWGRAEAVAGLWRDEGRLQARLAAGLDATYPGRLAPHLFGDASWQPDGPVVPTFEVHAGWADGQDDITATRLGGLTPYGVPLAGAAWAELWVEDYAMARLGGRVQGEHLHAGVGVDVAVWTLPGLTTADVVTGGSALGLAGLAGWHDRAAFADIAVGYSPTLPRAEGVWPAPVYLLVGSRWVEL